MSNSHFNITLLQNDVVYNGLFYKKILKDLTFKKNWKEKLLYIINISTKLSTGYQPLYTVENKVIGCEVNTWIFYIYDSTSERNYLIADSESKIIKGIIVMILSTYYYNPNLFEENINTLFSTYQILYHLNQTKTNSIQNIISYIKNLPTLS